MARRKNKTDEQASELLASVHAAAVKSGLKGGELIGDVYVRLGLILDQDNEVVKLATEKWDREVRGYAAEMGKK